MSETDLELLTRYTGQQAEDAFAEIVRRHVDLVFSAALRQVRSPQLAEEVAQSAFSDLARQAERLAPDTILSAWLYQVTRRTAIDVVRREARRQLREQVAVELTAMNAAADWTQIEPILDEAMAGLEETDRSAVLLRYFENKSMREVGQRLGTTEEAARKRVSRAVERLREFFTKRGVSVGASGLVVAITANAVQGAPAGLSVAITTAALAGTTITTTATATASITKAIAMTTIQKALIGATLVAAVGTGIYEARQASRLRAENQTLQQQQTPFSEQLQQLQREREEATDRLAAARDEIARLKAGPERAEVLKLRGEVGTLRQRLMASEAKSGLSGGGFAKMLGEPAMKEYMQRAMAEKMRTMYEPLIQELKLPPERVEKFIQLLVERGARGLATLSASPGTAEQAQAGQAAAEADQQVRAQLPSLLGEAGYARYNEYNDEIPARTTLTLLKEKLGDNQLNEEQSARVLQVIKAEPQDLTRGIVGSPDKAFSGSQAEIDDFLRQVAESNERIVQKTGSFLTADQLSALNAVLTNGIQSRKLQGAAFMQKR